MIKTRNSPFGVVKYEDLEVEEEAVKLEVLAIPKKGGAPKLLADPAEVLELARSGMSKGHIAEGLGFSRQTLTRRLDDSPELLAAYEQGRFEYRKDVLARYKKHAGNNLVGLIFESKNALGWTDREPVIGSGEPLKIIVSNVVLDTVDPDKGAIDITPAKLEGPPQNVPKEDKY